VCIGSSVMGVSERPATVTAMDCECSEESKMLDDVVEVIADDLVSSQVCRFVVQIKLITM